MTARRAVASGSRMPSRVNMRQKSGLGMGDCRSKTLLMPSSAERMSGFWFA
jgi:hypothetical protein